MDTLFQSRFLRNRPTEYDAHEVHHAETKLEELKAAAVIEDRSTTDTQMIPTISDAQEYMPPLLDLDEPSDPTLTQRVSVPKRTNGRA